MSFIIRNFKHSAYVERNPAQRLWQFTGSDRHATRFASIPEASEAIPAILEDCGDVWRVTEDDLGIIPAELR